MHRTPIISLKSSQRALTQTKGKAVIIQVNELKKWFVLMTRMQHNVLYVIR